METDIDVHQSNRPVAAIIVVFIALAVRGGICYWQFDQFSGDPDAYARIAATLAEHKVYGLSSPTGRTTPTAFRPPLYPFVLSALTSGGQVSAGGVACLHTALGVITVLCTYLTCQKLLGPGRNTKACVAAGLLVALDPILLQQSTLVMTETLATALASLVILCWVHCVPTTANQQWRIPFALLIGLLMGLAYLCRPTFLVWAVLLAIVIMLARESTWRTRLVCSGLIFLPVAIAMGCWTARNSRVMGHPIWATTHGGYTLLLANNPLFYDYLRDGRFGVAWNAESFLAAYQHRHDGDPSTAAFWHADWSSAKNEQTADPPGRRISEYADDRVCYQAARATINREPTMFVWSCVVRCARLWSPVPHHTPRRSWLKVAVIGLYYTTFYLAVLFGLWRLGRTVWQLPWWPVWTLAVALSLVHAVYWSNLRMRAPIIPALAVIAGAGLAPRKLPTTDE